LAIARLTGAKLSGSVVNTTLKPPLFAEFNNNQIVFRKEQGITQTQLAKMLGISQQTVAHYEVGWLRILVELLTILAKTLAVSVDELIEAPSPNNPAKRGSTSLLHKQIDQIGSMPRAKQKFTSEILDALIKQQQSA